jgi:hypothetical protein
MMRRRSRRDLSILNGLDMYMIASIPYKFGIALYHTNSVKAIMGKGDSIEDKVLRRYRP